MLEHLTSLNNINEKNEDCKIKCDFSCTEQAINRMKFLINKNPAKGDKLRVEVLGGGCAGFRYNFFFEKNIKENDLQISQDDLIILIDSTSAKFLDGCSLDYVQNLGSAYFKIENPQASTECGCGNSFSS